MHQKYFIVVLILLTICGIQHALVTLAVTTIGVISSIVTIYLAAEQKLSDDSTAKEINTNIFKLCDVIDNKLKKFNLELENIERSIQNRRLIEKYTQQYEQVHSSIDRINFLYKETQKWILYMKKNKGWDLDKKTDQMISLDSDYPQSVLFDLSRHFFQIRRRSKPSFLNKYHDVILQPSNEILCHEDLTPHYQLYFFYKQIIYAEIKGFAAMAFSYMWRFSNNAYNDTDEMNDVKKQRIENIIKYTELFRDKMKFARNYIRRCNRNYIENKTMIDHEIYAAFDNVFYKIALFREHFEPTDTITGMEIPDPFRLCQIHNDCSDDNHRYDKICPGLIKNCQRALTIEYCQRNEKDQTSTKKYYWMIVRNLEKSMNFGDTNHPCEPFPFHRKNIFHTDYVKNIQIPVYCDCIDDSIHTRNDTIRAFSLLWSQTSDNMVATGARLVAKDRMIHIQLREGKLLPHGEIDKKTERWVPLPTFKYDRNFPNEAIDSNGKRFSLNENIDFVLINHLYARTICLQKLTFDEEHLLTGVRFDYESINGGFVKHIKLEAKYVGFNYQHGNITTYRKYKEQSCRKLPELIINNPDDPLKFIIHPRDSKENQFIKIRASDLIEDASQTTLPFFDLLEVAPETSLPITAIELFHKGQFYYRSGGYISMKIYPINLTMYMNPPSSPESIDISFPDMESISKYEIPNQFLTIVKNEIID